MALSERTKEILKSGYDYQGLALDMYEDKCDNCIELQKRIDKAIEYIDNELLPFGNEWHWDNAGIEDSVVELRTKLRGKDNERN